MIRPRLANVALDSDRVPAEVGTGFAMRLLAQRSSEVGVSSVTE